MALVILLLEVGIPFSALFRIIPPFLLGREKTTTVRSVCAPYLPFFKKIHPSFFLFVFGVADILRFLSALL